MSEKEILEILKKRFDENMSRHEHIKWSEVESKLIGNKTYIDTLIKMEETGGEPDVVLMDNDKGELIFIDCSKESPKGRRSVCYDHKALESRKKFPPKDSAMQMAKNMGIKILDEDDYLNLQKHGLFDNSTSSWIITPDSIRNLGGALFCDCRYDTVFKYHNGADSYYSSRGFRGKLNII